jgi:hypothetical protein
VEMPIKRFTLKKSHNREKKSAYQKGALFFFSGHAES